MNGIKINNDKIVKRWNDVMVCVGLDHICIPGEVTSPDCREYYCVEDGITVEWMIHEAEYWLSCYYEEGNVRHDDKYDGGYATWRSETGKLKRLIARLKNEIPEMIVVGWEDK